MARIGILYDERLPYKGVRPRAEELNRLGSRGEWIHLDNWREKLAEPFDSLINLQGPYFIKEAWTLVLEHLRKGRGLIHVGAAMLFSVPVRSSGEGGCTVTVERPQTSCHEQLYLFDAMPIEAARYERLASNPDIPLLEGFEECFDVEPTISLIVQFARGRDVAHELGSSGPMDTFMHSLLDGLGADGRKKAAPAVLVEHRLGEYEGGQWVLVHVDTTERFWEKGGAELLLQLAVHTAGKLCDVQVRPGYATYHPGERPAIMLQAQHFGSEGTDARIELILEKDGKVLHETSLERTISRNIGYESIPVPIQVEPGEYAVTARVSLNDGKPRTYRNGFWGYDRQLLESGEPLTVDADYFQLDGKPLPINGMTYMASDAHRHFLQLPNVHVWSKDFLAMKQAGINMVRTGIWTGFRHTMFLDGAPREDILRAVDAFILTASKYRMPIVFTFFSFYPEMWEGVNPYLDPRSLQAQKRYITSITGRHCASKMVSWDLINEPTIGSPKSLWWQVPNGDRYERQAWCSWLKERHGSIEELQEKWNIPAGDMPSFEAAALPAAEDLTAGNHHWGTSKSQKAVDFRLFTQQVLIDWASELIGAIRSSSCEQMVTVGQDEALVTRRPSPFFYQEAPVGYTTNHTWGQNDDLFWDGIFSKSPGKPNLIQETGTANPKKPDRTQLYTEEQMRNLMEHKFGTALAANNAGSVYWLWNINIYLDSYAEANIGAVRADGTHKLESDMVHDFGDFLQAAGELFCNRKKAKVAAVYPYSNSFAVSETTIAATKRLARIMAHHLSVPFEGYGEYHLEELGDERLIMLPSPMTLSNGAWNRLLGKVEAGACLLLTGPISNDEYWVRNPGRAEQLGMATSPANVVREETLLVDGVEYRVAYGNNRIQSVWKEVPVGQGTDQLQLTTIPYGRGKVLWSPLPVELNDEDEVVRAVYLAALKEAGVELPWQWDHPKPVSILLKKLSFDNGAVYILLSEQSSDFEAAFLDRKTGVHYRLMVPGERLAMFATDANGQVVKSYRSLEVKATFGVY